MTGQKSKIEDNKLNTRHIDLKADHLDDIKKLLTTSREGELIEKSAVQKVYEWNDDNGIVITLSVSDNVTNLCFRGDKGKTDELLDFLSKEKSITFNPMSAKDGWHLLC